MDIITWLEFVDEECMINGIKSFREVYVTDIQLRPFFQGRNYMVVQYWEISEAGPTRKKAMLRKRYVRESEMKFAVMDNTFKDNR